MAFGLAAFDEAPFADVAPAGGGGSSASVAFAGSGVFAPTVGTAVSVSFTGSGVFAPVSLIAGVTLSSPYLCFQTDTLPSPKTYDIYSATGGVISLGNTSGFFDSGNGHINNAFGVEAQYVPDGLYGDFEGVQVYPGIVSGGQTVATMWPLNFPPTAIAANISKAEVSTFLATDNIGSVIAQTLTLSAVSGAGVAAAAGGGAPFAVGNNPVGKFINEVVGNNGRGLITARTDDTHVVITVIDTFSTLTPPSNGWSFGVPTYSIRALNGVGGWSSPSSVGVWAVPKVKNGYAVKITRTPDDAYGTLQYTILWFTG